MPLLQCWKCQRHGHDAGDCLHKISIESVTLLQSYSHYEQDDGYEEQDCTPTTPEVLEYAQRQEAEARSWCQKQHGYLPWSESSRAVPTARTCVAKFCAVVSGSDAAQSETTRIRLASTAASEQNNVKTTDLRGFSLIETPARKTAVRTMLQAEREPGTGLRAAEPGGRASTEPDAGLQRISEQFKVTAHRKKQKQGYASLFTFTFDEPASRTTPRAPSAIAPTPEVQEILLEGANSSREPACKIQSAVESPRITEQSLKEAKPNNGVFGDEQAILLVDTDNSADNRDHSALVGGISSLLAEEAVNTASPACLIDSAKCPEVPVPTEVTPKPPGQQVCRTKLPPESAPAEACEELDFSKFDSTSDDLLLETAYSDSDRLSLQTTCLQVPETWQYLHEPCSTTITPIRTDQQEQPLKAFLEGANVTDTVTIHGNYPLSCHASLYRYSPGYIRPFTNH